MKFKIGEISRLSGFSTSGIRFFEEAGVISPARGKNEKYREFSLEDLQRLLICRNYRECGFSLEESVHMLHHKNAQELKRHILKQTDCIKRQLVEKQARLEYLYQQISFIEHIEESSHCEIVQMPSLFWLKLWQPGDREEDIAPFPHMYEWLERGPIINSCLLLQPEALLSGEGNLETSWGVAVEEKVAELISFTPLATPRYFPSCQAVRIAISPTNRLTIPSGQLLEVRDFLNKENLEVTGPALSRFFYCTINEDHLVRYDHLWIPIRKP